MIEREEFSEWLLHPVTKVVLNALRQKREDMKNDWEGGSFADYTKDATILVNVGNLGTCKGYAWITDLTYEQLASEIEDD